MVAIKSKSIDEIASMADQRLPVPGADVAWLVKRVRELEGALHRLERWGTCFIEDTPITAETIWREFPDAVKHARAVLLAKADQEDPV